MGTRIRATAMALLVCIVLAGCVGGAGDGAGTTTVAGEETTATVEENSNTRVTETSTGTDATTNSNSHPLSDGSIVADHATALRAAENFTVRTNTTIRESGTNEFGYQNGTARVDVTTGEALNRVSTTQVGAQITYVAPDGRAYQRTEYYEGASPDYYQPSSDYGVTKQVESAPKWFVDAYNYTYDGTTTVDGTSVHEYTVTSVDQLADRGETLMGYNPDNATDIDVRLTVTDEGRVHELNYRLELEGDTIRLQKTYTALGATEVESPSWLDEAKAEIESTTTVPDPTREVTETVRDDSLGATVTVNGPKYAFEDLDAFELERQTGGIWDTGEGGYRKAQVSALVGVEFPYDSEVNVTGFELSYNESTVPAGDEGGLDLYRYEETRQTFVEVENTVDTEDDVVRAEIDGDGTYLVMHTPTWRELFR